MSIFTEALLNSWILALIGMVFHFITKLYPIKKTKGFRKETIEWVISLIICFGILYAGEGSIDKLSGASNVGKFGVVIFGYFVKSQWRKLPAILDSLVVKTFGRLLNQK